MSVGACELGTFHILFQKHSITLFVNLMQFHDHLMNVMSLLFKSFDTSSNV